MGLTLIEAAKFETRIERLAVIKTFTEGQLIGRLPFRNLSGGSMQYPVERKLPRVGFRAVNEGYNRDYGAAENRAEFVHLFGGDLDVDRSIVDLNGPEARASQTEQKVRSMRMTLENALVNGDASLDPRAFNGQVKLLPTTDAATINNGGSTVSIAKLEALVDSVTAMGGEKVLIGGRAARRQISAACRAVTGSDSAQPAGLGPGPGDARDVPPLRAAGGNAGPQSGATADPAALLPGHHHRTDRGDAAGAVSPRGACRAAAGGTGADEPAAE
jgi:hypothetical protein